MLRMEKPVGIIDISALNTPPEKHEYEAARYFAKRGKNVVFLKPSNVEKQHTPDFLMDGKMWELKSPIVYGRNSFEDNLRRAVKQSEHIIYDLRYLSVNDERKYIRELNKWVAKKRIKTLLLIKKNGQLLTIKGTFDIINI